MQTRRRHDPPEDQAPSPDRRPPAVSPARLAALPRIGSGPAAAYMAGLQRGYGNAAVASALARTPLDPKGDAKEPLPGWGDPELGDDESVAAFDLTGGFWPDGTPGPTPQLMVVWNEDGGFSGTGKVKGAGELKLFVDSDFRIDEATDVNVTHAFRAFWKVKPKNKWGDLEIGKGSVKRGQVKGVGNSAREVQLTGLETEELADSVILKATFTGPSATETFIVNKDRSYAAPTMTVKFKVRLQMEGAHLGPKPPAYNLHPQSFFFPEGKSDFTDRHAVQLADFLKTHRDAHQMLIDTDVPDEGRVRISAFASPKGRPVANLDLAGARAEAVRKRLEQFGIRPANIRHGFTPGELGDKAKGEPPGNEATAAEQRVDILLPEKRPEEKWDGGPWTA